VALLSVSELVRRAKRDHTLPVRNLTKDQNPVPSEERHHLEEVKMADIEKASIEKFCGDNWTTWSFQMMHLLKTRKLWRIVKGEEVLNPTWGEKKTSEFEDRVDKAMGAIVLYMKPDQLYLITSAKTPDAAWKMLTTQFEKDTASNRIYLKKQFFRLAMKEGTPLQQHLKAMKEITDRLSCIKCKIEEEDKVVTLLGSLPKSYNSVVTALENRPGELDMRTVQEALLHEERKMSDQKDSDDQKPCEDTVLVGAHKPKPGQTKVRCYRCGKRGHFANDCSDPPKKGQESHTAGAAMDLCPDCEQLSEEDECAF